MKTLDEDRKKAWQKGYEFWFRGKDDETCGSPEKQGDLALARFDKRVDECNKRFNNSTTKGE